MATDTQTSEEAEVQDSTDSSGSRREKSNTASGPAGFLRYGNNANNVGGVKIYSVTAGGRSGTGKSIKVEGGDTIEITGERLNLFDSAILRLGSSQNSPRNFSVDKTNGKRIVFTVPEFKNYKGVIWVELRGAGGQGGLLYEDLEYTSAEEENEKESEEKKASQGAGEAESGGGKMGELGGVASFVNESLDVIGKAVSPFVPQPLIDEQKRKDLKAAVKNNDKKEIKKEIEDAKKRWDKRGLQQALREAGDSDTKKQIQEAIDYIDKNFDYSGGQKTNVSQVDKELMAQRDQQAEEEDRVEQDEEAPGDEKVIEEQATGGVIRKKAPKKWRAGFAEAAMQGAGAVVGSAGEAAIGSAATVIGGVGGTNISGTQEVEQNVSEKISASGSVSVSGRTETRVSGTQQVRQTVSAQGSETTEAQEQTKTSATSKVTATGTQETQQSVSSESSGSVKNQTQARSSVKQSASAEVESSAQVKSEANVETKGQAKAQVSVGRKGRVHMKGRPSGGSRSAGQTGGGQQTQVIDEEAQDAGQTSAAENQPEQVSAEQSSEMEAGQSPAEIPAEGGGDQEVSGNQSDEGQASQSGKQEQGEVGAKSGQHKKGLLGNILSISEVDKILNSDQDSLGPKAGVGDTKYQENPENMAGGDGSTGGDVPESGPDGEGAAGQGSENQPGQEPGQEQAGQQPGQGEPGITPAEQADKKPEASDGNQSSGGNKQEAKDGGKNKDEKKSVPGNDSEKGPPNKPKSLLEKALDKYSPNVQDIKKGPLELGKSGFPRRKEEKGTDDKGNPKTDKQSGPQREAGWRRMRNNLAKGLQNGVSEQELNKLIQTANRLFNQLLERGAEAVWVGAPETFGLTILIGAVVGDLLWAFKSSVIRAVLNKVLPTDDLKGKGEQVAKKIKIGVSIKLHIAAMNGIVLWLIGILFMAGVLLLEVGCHYPTITYQAGKLVGSYSGSVIGALGGSAGTQVCETLDNAMNAATGINPTSANLTSQNGGTCQVMTSGPVSVSALSQTCFGSNAQAAAEIANVESSGSPTAKGDKCADGNYASWGLFQINISATDLPGLACHTAFDKPAAPATLISPGLYNCHVTNPGLYQQCMQAAETTQINITQACAMSKNGTIWTPWTNSANKCNLPK